MIGHLGGAGGEGSVSSESLQEPSSGHTSGSGPGSVTPLSYLPDLLTSSQVSKVSATVANLLSCRPYLQPLVHSPVSCLSGGCASCPPVSPGSPVTSLSQLQPPVPLPGIETFARDPEPEDTTGYLSLARSGPGEPGYLCPLVPWSPGPEPGPAHHHAILGSLQPIKPELLRDSSDLVTPFKTEARTPGPDLTLSSSPVTLTPATSGGQRLGFSLAKLTDTHMPQLPSSSTKSSEFWRMFIKIWPYFTVLSP